MKFKEELRYATIILLSALLILGFVFGATLIDTDIFCSAVHILHL